MHLLSHVCSLFIYINSLCTSARHPLLFAARFLSASSLLKTPGLSFHLMLSPPPLYWPRIACRTVSLSSASVGLSATPAGQRRNAAPQGYAPLGPGIARQEKQKGWKEGKHQIDIVTRLGKNDRTVWLNMSTRQVKPLITQRPSRAAYRKGRAWS